MEKKTTFLVFSVLVAAAVVITLYFESNHRHRMSGADANSTGSAKYAMAPEFSLTDLDGQTLDLAAYKGKVVLLDFWATWCEPCREEIPQFVRMQSALKDQGFQVVGISMDDAPQPVREFYTHFDMNYPVALGGARIGELYGGIFGLPVAYLIERDGRVYSKHVGTIDFSAFEAEVKSRLSSTQ